MTTHRRRGYRRSDGVRVRPTIVHTSTVASAAPPAGQERVIAAAEAVNNPPDPPTPYHRRFRRFHPAALEATRSLFQAKIHSLDPLEATVRMQQWVNEVSVTYNTNPPTVRWVSPGEAAGHGCYVPSLDEIRMPKASVMTLLHEYRHALQHRGVPMVEATHGPPNDQVEEDARAWSMSLFSRVAPKRFRRLALEGKIFHVEPETLVAFAERAERDARDAAQPQQAKSGGPVERSEGSSQVPRRL